MRRKKFSRLYKPVFADLVSLKCFEWKSSSGDHDFKKLGLCRAAGAGNRFSGLPSRRFALRPGMTASVDAIAELGLVFSPGTAYMSFTGRSIGAEGPARYVVRFPG